MNTDGPNRVKAVGDAWRQVVAAAKAAAAKPPVDLTPPEPRQEGK